MMIGDRLRAWREHKNLSQGDVEARTGLLRCYISRVENGYTVPAVETLEKFARALEIPLCAIFYGTSKDNRESVEPRDPDTRQTRRILEAMARLSRKEREFIVSMAKAMASKRRR